MQPSRTQGNSVDSKLKRRLVIVIAALTCGGAGSVILGHSGGDSAGRTPPMQIAGGHWSGQFTGTDPGGTSAARVAPAASPTARAR